MREAIKDADILYMTRVQRERFSDLMEYERVKSAYVLKADMLEGTRDNLRILHPLPRITEIDTDVDSDPQSLLFRTGTQRSLHPSGHHILSVRGQIAIPFS